MGMDEETREAADRTLVELIEAHLRRKYVVHADARQKAMGLSYLTAETADLARYMARLFTAMNEPLVAALAPLSAIADAYDANELDDEARKCWGGTYQFENTTPHHRIELYAGRGGQRLLTLQHCMEARSAVQSLQNRENAT